MGKGGGGAPPNQQVTSTTSNLPEYAKPYFTNLLKRGQAESYREYTPYQGERIAGLTPAQLQTQRDVMGMEQPGQFGVGTGMAGAGGIGSLQYGQQAAGAGSQFFGMAQDPASVQSFMSPYQQSVTDVARKAAIRDAQMAQQQINLGSVRQGTYGGARQALAQGERERGLLDRLAGIQAEGSQKAFEDARRTQQFGSTLGLQGFQTGLQGAQQATQAGQALGQLGTAAQDANLKRFQAQSAVGEQQRALEQQRLDQKYADFLRQRDYPMEQLGQYSALLRGLPMQMGSTQTTYAPPPSIASQIGGLGLAAYGLSGAAKGFADGGSVRSFAEGGETDGPYMLQKPKDIAMEYGGNKQKIEQAAKMGLIDPTAAVMAGMFIDTMRNAQQEEMMPEQTVAQDTFAPPQMAGLGATPQAAQMAQMAPQMMPTEAGVAALPLSEDTFTAAGGGMIAFDDGGSVARFDVGGGVSLNDVLRTLTPDQRLIYENTGQLPPGAQAMLDSQAAPRKLPSNIEAILSQAERGQGPNVSRPGTIDRAPQGLTPGTPEDRSAFDKTGQMPPGVAFPFQPEVEEEEAVAAAPSANLRGIDMKSIIERAGQMSSALRPETQTKVPTVQEASQQTSDLLKESGFDSGIFDKIRQDVEKQREGLKENKSESINMRLIEAGLGIMSGTSANAFENIGKGATGALRGLSEDFKDLRKSERDLKSAEQNLMIKQNDLAMGKANITQSTIDKAQQRLDKETDNYNKSQSTFANTMLSGEIQERLAKASLGTKLTDFDKQWSIYSKDAKARGENPTLDGFRRALEGSRSVVTNKEATKMALEAAKNSGLDLQNPKDQAEFENLKRYFMQQGGGGSGAPSSGKTPPLPPGYVLQ